LVFSHKFSSSYFLPLLSAFQLLPFSSSSFSFSAFQLLPLKSSYGASDFLQAVGHGAELVIHAVSDVIQLGEHLFMAGGGERGVYDKLLFELGDAAGDYFHICHGGGPGYLLDVQGVIGDFPDLTLSGGGAGGLVDLEI
jgi:hypothetical protein